MATEIAPRVASNDIPAGTTVKKEQIALLLEIESKLKRIKKSESLELSIEAKTTERNFIADAKPSEMLDSYVVSIAQDLTMIKGEEDFEFIWSKFYDSIAKNIDVKIPCVIPFMFDGNKTDGYKAWKTEAQILFTSLNAVDSKINFDVNFGDIILGVAKVDPSTGETTFTEASA